MAFRKLFKSSKKKKPSTENLSVPGFDDPQPSPRLPETSPAHQRNASYSVPGAQSPGLQPSRLNVPPAPGRTPSPSQGRRSPLPPTSPPPSSYYPSSMQQHVPQQTSDPRQHPPAYNQDPFQNPWASQPAKVQYAPPPGPPPGAASPFSSPSTSSSSASYTPYNQSSPISLNHSPPDVPHHARTTSYSPPTTLYPQPGASYSSPASSYPSPPSSLYHQSSSSFSSNQPAPPPPLASTVSDGPFPPSRPPLPPKPIGLSQSQPAPTPWDDDFPVAPRPPPSPQPGLSSVSSKNPFKAYLSPQSPQLTTPSLSSSSSLSAPSVSVLPTPPVATSLAGQYPPPPNSSTSPPQHKPSTSSVPITSSAQQPASQQTSTPKQSPPAFKEDPFRKPSGSQPAAHLASTQPEVKPVIERQAAKPPAQSSSYQPPPVFSVPSSEQPKPQPQSAPQPKPQPTPQPKPQSTSQSTPQSTPQPKPQPTPQPKSPPPPQQIKGLPLFQHEIFGTIFKVTLDKPTTTLKFDEVWLEDFAKTLKQEGVALPKMNLALADRVLTARLEVKKPTQLDYKNERAEFLACQTVFQYLVGCWQRVRMAKTDLPNTHRAKYNLAPSDISAGNIVLDNLRQTILSYIGLSLKTPDMFPQPKSLWIGSIKPGPSELVTALLAASGTVEYPPNHGRPASPRLTSIELPQFLEQLSQELVRRLEENELDGVFGPVVRLLVAHSSLSAPTGITAEAKPWKGVLVALETLVKIKPIAAMFTRLSEWIPMHATAQNFEYSSLLGPVCRLNIFMQEWPQISRQYYGDAPLSKGEIQLAASHTVLRSAMKLVHLSLFRIFDSIVRSSPEARGAVLKYFARVITLNRRRAGSQVDTTTVSSDGFMFNLQIVLLKLADPFVTVAAYGKIDRIDSMFFATSDLLDIKDETRMSATAEEATHYAELNVRRARISETAPPNFISEIFFLTIAMNRISYARIVTSYLNLKKQADDLVKVRNIITTAANRSLNPPLEYDLAIAQLTVEINQIMVKELPYVAMVYEPDVVAKTLAFSSFMSVWLVRMADPKKAHPKSTISLPLPQEVPQDFSTLPEYFLEDLVDHQSFVLLYRPSSFDAKNAKEELLLFTLTILSSPWCVKKPALKNKIISNLLLSILGYGTSGLGPLSLVLNKHAMSLQHLLPALTHYYVEIEGHPDKMSIRRTILVILKAIWNSPTQRSSFAREARNVNKFVRFVNHMVNDATYLLDESLAGLVKINQIENEMNNSFEWLFAGNQYRRSRENELDAVEGRVTIYISGAHTTMELLMMFTKETKGPYVMPEIVDRLAAMLNYNLNELVGPKCQNLRVKDPARLGWNPRLMLGDVIDIYLNLCEQEAFIAAVAKDGRSYSKSLFDTACSITLGQGLKTEAGLGPLRKFVEKVEAHKQKEASDDLLMEGEDIPDDYMDPLMCTLMRDPVILPTSKAIVDRTTIQTHLLSDQTDPFNRIPLKIEDVKPATELKKEIDTFVAEKRRQATLKPASTLSPGPSTSSPRPPPSPGPTTSPAPAASYTTSSQLYLTPDGRLVLRIVPSASTTPQASTSGTTGGGLGWGDYGNDSYEDDIYR